MSYFFILTLLFLNLQSDQIFLGKKQVCTSSNVIDKEWKLTLKKDRTFEYVISEFNSVNYKMSVKNDTLRFNGFWQFYDDTLFLHSLELSKHCNKDVKYKKRGESLYSIGACIDSLKSYSVEKLDFYSRKIKNRN